MFYSITPDRFEELAASTANLFKGHLAESYYTRAHTGKSAGGVFQTYYSKQREKEIGIGHLTCHQREKRKRKAEGWYFINGGKLMYK